MPDSPKYLIHAAIAADGVVERSDVVGAIYGQTEGLLGEELDLRRLQESSKLGRIDVEIETSGGQSVGELTVATSLDRVETATLAAALETIDRVGPCRATLEVTELEDVRAAKRREVIERAERLLVEEFEETTSEAIVEQVRRRVATADVTTYEGLPAGPRVPEADALVVVEGRADVQAVLAAGVKNAVAVEGTDVPEPVAELTTERTTTAFMDGDRGGELILRELRQVGDVDYVAVAPRSQSVEDLSRSQILGALRSKVAVDGVADATTASDLAEAARARTSGGVVPERAEDALDAPGEDVTDPGAPAGDAADGDVEDATAAGEATPTGDATATGDATPAEPSAAPAESGPSASGSAGAAPTPDDGADAAADPVGAEPDEPVDADGVDADRVGDAPDGGSVATTEAATDAGASDDGPTSDDAAVDAGSAAAPSAADAAPRTLHGHVEALRDTGHARLLDADADALATVDAGAAFDGLEDADPAPDVVVLDDELDQRLLDLAAQRGVREVVAASLGEFTKRPTDVRVRTAAQLLDD